MGQPPATSTRCACVSSRPSLRAFRPRPWPRRYGCRVRTPADSRSPDQRRRVDQGVQDLADAAGGRPFLEGVELDRHQPAPSSAEPRGGEGPGSLGTCGPGRLGLLDVAPPGAAASSAPSTDAELFRPARDQPPSRGCSVSSTRWSDGTGRPPPSCPHPGPPHTPRAAGTVRTTERPAAARSAPAATPYWSAQTFERERPHRSAEGAAVDAGGSS